MRMDFSALRYLSLALLLPVLSCLNESDPGRPVTPTGKSPSTGSFRVTLVPPAGATAGHTAFSGAIYTGPSPELIIWTEVAKAGACRLLTPRAPSCATPCGSNAGCIDDNVCKEYPTLLTAGTLTVKGVKTSQGASHFTLDPLLNRYQPIGVSIAYPPFAEGEEVAISLTGESGIQGFTITAKGIPPLDILNDSIVVADGKPIVLEWVGPTTPNSSSISILVDLSHHGGSKGEIECEGPDNGKMEIPATLADQLKSLGMSGFPKAEVARKTIATHAESKVDLVLESLVTLTLSVPGLISCSSDDQCPTGQTCQKDLQCK